VRQKGSAQKFPEAFSGTKEASFLFADNHGLIMGVGHNARNTRQLKLFDPKKLDAGAIHTTDETQTAGALLPFWSEDNNILYTAGRGDATVRYWELANKEFHALSLFKDNKAHKGVAFAPKRACNIKKCEIARCIRVMGESPTLHIVNFLVPRKSDLFQADLYPETYAGVATMSTADFKEGNDKQPSKMSLKPGDAPVERPKAEFVAKRSAEDYEKEIAQLKAEIERLKVKAGEA
jgi:coronin-1B/1C/6